MPTHPFSHTLTQNGFWERDFDTFAGKSGFRLVPKITKKVNILQYSLAYFGCICGTKDLKTSFRTWCPCLHSPHSLAECTFVYCSLFWAFVCNLCLSACTYSYSLSFFSLVSQWGFSPFKENSIRERKQSACFTAPSLRSQWQVDHNCCTTSSSRRFWALISSQEQIVFWWPSSFPFFNHSPWWQETSVNRRQVSSQEKEWNN